MKTLSITVLENKLKLIEGYISNSEHINTNVSKASVGWHLDHSLKVINGVTKTMQASDPKDYKNNFSLMGRFFLSLGTFPRGKAKAPKSVMPPEKITRGDIIHQLEEAKKGISKLPELNENAFFKHPLFGNINKRHILSFLDTHTNHHLKIVKGILK